MSEGRERGAGGRRSSQAGPVPSPLSFGLFLWETRVAFTVCKTQEHSVNLSDCE